MKMVMAVLGMDQHENGAVAASSAWARASAASMTARLASSTAGSVCLECAARSASLV